MNLMTFHILGISSSQLTHIFQRGRYTTNQPFMVSKEIIVYLWEIISFYGRKFQVSEI